MSDIFSKLHPIALNAWRIIIGFTFFTHGGQKLFGWFGGTAVAEPMSLFGAAGVLETFGGLAIVLGLRTQYVAFVLSGQMAVAYWYQHVGNGKTRSRPSIIGGEPCSSGCKCGYNQKPTGNLKHHTHFGVYSLR